ncbi:MAG TPA: glycine/sarcosine/betaine reductase selenoprotein B family protein, partial [Anaerolineales bacterium]|nr:glycine/sarcosine/betaine reductase selenoprotein B family protein [Anaerolineales bacterium]
MTDNLPIETFEEFKNSFSYGSRTDMNFKFLKSLSIEESGGFFRELLWKIGDASNDGNLDPVVEHFYNWQVKAYTGKPIWEYDESPFSPLGKPLSESSIGLLTTSGHYVEGEDPEPFGVKGMDQGTAQARISDFIKSEPVLSMIPTDSARENLLVRHGGYDIRAAEQDFNTVLPMDRLVELEQDGFIGSVLGN